MKRSLILLFLLSLLSNSLFAQLVLKNQSEYSHWQNKNRTIWENWTDLTYQHNYFKTGFRFEINEPPDRAVFPNPKLVQNYELTYRFIEFNYKGFTARLGNFYSLFGRGLTLRSYEDRNLRVDNSLDGINLKYRSKSFQAQLLGGKMRDLYNRQDKFIYGADLGYRVNRQLKIGTSTVIQNADRTNSTIAANINYIYDWFDLYLELAYPQWQKKLSSYLAINTAFETFTLTAEYKKYNGLKFPNKYAIEYAAAPSLSREHSFTLLSRHPHALNMDNERGLQFELTWFPDDIWQVLLNYSRTIKLNNLLLFEEYYAEASRSFGSDWEVLTAIDWNFDLTTNTENLSPLLDFYYNLDSQNQLHVSFQHQHTKNLRDKSEYDSELALLEFSHSPWLTLALVGETTNQDQLNNISLEKNSWLYGNVIFSFWGNQQLSVLYGSRQAGFVCVGGVCRYEPEFEGIEIKLSNRF